MDETSLNFYLSVEETQYIELIEIEVLAACTNQSKPAKKITIELVKWILRQRTQT